MTPSLARIQKDLNRFDLGLFLFLIKIKSLVIS